MEIFQDILIFFASLQIAGALRERRPEVTRGNQARWKIWRNLSNYSRDTVFLSCIFDQFCFGVETYADFLKYGYRYIIHFNRIFPHKRTILGYPQFRKPPYEHD